MMGRIQRNELFGLTGDVWSSLYTTLSGRIDALLYSPVEIYAIAASDACKCDPLAAIVTKDVELLLIMDVESPRMEKVLSKPSKIHTKTICCYEVGEQSTRYFKQMTRAPTHITTAKVLLKYFPPSTQSHNH